MNHFQNTNTLLSVSIQVGQLYIHSQTKQYNQQNLVTQKDKQQHIILFTLLNRGNLAIEQLLLKGMECPGSSQETESFQKHMT